MLQKTYVIIAGLLVNVFSVHAQAVDTTRKAHIIVEQQGNHVQLSADTPPLVQISGAPEAFYTYFWEFGDGHYSKEESPKHTYEGKGEHEVRLQVTNNYDNGKPPPSRPVKVKTSGSGQPTASLNGDFEGFELLKSREPVPEEEMVVVVRYENEYDYATNGKLYLYYNERKFKNDNFNLVGVRTHHGEQRTDQQMLSGIFNHTGENYQWASLSSKLVAGKWYLPHFPKDSVRKEHIYITIDKAEQDYRDRVVFEFNDLDPGEGRNIFLSLETTPEMIQDTSAIIKMRGVFVPDERSESHQVKDLEMEIVTSHDPNKMAVNDTRINYRLRKHKKLKYKVRFQNNGEGPATTIRLNIDVPDIIDKSTLEVVDMYPKCQICPDMEVTYSCLDTLLMDNQVAFIFRNIYLPGSNQQGVNAYDSTKGFVSYRVQLKDKAPKLNSSSRTAIIFDKNEPILTNYAKTHFKPGLSLGAIAGYRAISALDENRDYFLGLTVSPYMPYRGYLQAELMVGYGTYRAFSESETRAPFGNGTDLTELIRTAEEADYEYINLTLVPVSYRYNVNKFLGVGAGIQLSTRLYEQAERQIDNQYFIEGPNGTLEPNLDRNETVRVSESENLHDFNPGVFAGINLGSARIGPAAGLRYVYQLNEPHTQWVCYLSWKF